MTARMGVVGLVIGPVLRSWYLTLERIVPGGVKTAGFKKMLLYQSLFLSVWETLAGKRPHEINEMLQECYVQTLMITNYKIWLLAQTLNFTFVPIQHRVGFVQIVAIFWNVYLSWMANKPSPDATALTVKDPLRAGAVMWLTSAPSVWLVHSVELVNKKFIF